MDRRIEKFTPSRTSFYLFALLLFISGVFLSSCGASAGANAKKACGIVNNSLATYRTATIEANPAQSAQDKAKALTMLRNALPLAAIASGSNLEYQALKATLSESNRVPEKLLVNALTRECRQILPTAPGQQVPGGYVPPANVKVNPSQ
jgi:hypothetical protein